jgi:cell division protein FtsI (penicillin-binding protein 3)
VEHELAVTVEATGAESGFAVLYEAPTGAIRAMANVPTYNPDTYAQSADPGRRRNRVITDPYEPGSMFKVVAASAALAEGKVRPEEVIDCQNGRIEVAGRTIRDSHPNGEIPFREVIARSSNVGTIKVAMRVSPAKFYEHIRLYGFGAETGVDLPGESKGILGKRSAWSARSQATIAIGQEISVTALQVAAAYGALADDGWLMRPRLVEQLTAPNGEVIRRAEPVRVRQVIPAAVANEMVELLCGVVEEGTGTTAKIAGLRVAGKTGTAEIARSDGRGYEPGAYIASFIGFLPEMTPRLVCAVSVVRPHTVYYGSAVAGPTFKRIMSRIVNRDGAIIRTPANVNGQQMPDVTGLDKLAAAARLDTFGVAVHMVGKGNVVIGQWPPASARIPDGKPVELILASRAESGPTVPDVRGMTLRQAVTALAAARLDTRIEGSGVVVSQDPRPGSRPVDNAPVLLRGEPSAWERWVRRTE